MIHFSGTRYIIPQTRSRDDSNSRMVKRKTVQDIRREILTYPDPIYRPPPKPTEIPLKEIHRKLMDLDTYINTDFKENSPFQLDSLISTGKLVQKFLPKQAGIDKILKLIQRKVLKRMHLHVTVKEIQVGYLISLILKICICM